MLHYIFTGVEDKLIATRVAKGRRDKPEYWDYMLHTMLCIKQITSRDLLYSTGSSSLLPVKT